jgi:multicomponent Na+:H+ antiporter subunit E
MGFWLTVIIMYSFWILLSGYFDFLHLFLGAISSLLVASWSHDLFIGKTDIIPGLKRILRLIKYLPWLFWQIILANLNLVYLTLHPKMPIDPEIIRFKTDLKTNLGIVTLANSITLTPGTVTIEGNHEEFIVHAINKSAAESLLSEEMQTRVKEVEGKGV